MITAPEQTVLFSCLFHPTLYYVEMVQTQYQGHSCTRIVRIRNLKKVMWMQNLLNLTGYRLF